MLFNIYIFYYSWTNVCFSKPLKCSAKSVAHTLTIFEQLILLKMSVYRSSDLSSLSMLNKVSYLFKAEFGLKSLFNSFLFPSTFNYTMHFLKIVTAQRWWGWVLEILKVWNTSRLFKVWWQCDLLAVGHFFWIIFRKWHWKHFFPYLLY